MADSSFGAQPITLDLTVTGARVIRNAPERIRISSLELVGAHAATNGNLVLRQDSASGQIVWVYSNQDATGGAFTAVAENRFSDFSEHLQQLNGLYMDAISVAWLGTSVLVIWYD